LFGNKGLTQNNSSFFAKKTVFEYNQVDNKRMIRDNISETGNVPAIGRECLLKRKFL